MNIRTASLLLAFMLASVPAFAQKKDPLTERVAALEASLAAAQARLAKIESGQVAEADIIGTWKWISLGIEKSPNPAEIKHSTGVSTFTFRADGTATLTGAEGHAKLQQLTPLSSGMWQLQFEQDDPQTFELTWSVQDGKLSISGFDGPIEVAAGGRMIVYGQGNACCNGFGTWSYILIAVKMP